MTMVITRRGLTLLVAAIAAGCADLPDDMNGTDPEGASSATEQKSQAVVDGDPCEAPRLLTYWSATNEDNYTGTSGWPGSGYTYVGGDGFILDFAAPSTIQLKQYYGSARGDYMLVAAGGASEQAAQVSGYAFQRNVGYAYPSQVAGTVPLRWFWHAGRGDNFATALQASANIALAAGYQEVGVIAYVFPDQPVKTLATYWSQGRLDYVTTTRGSWLEGAAVAAGYTRSDDDSYVFKYAVPGTTELESYWSAARTEHVLLSVAHRSDATGAGYSLVQSEGYALTDPVSSWTFPLVRYWHSEYQDNWTSSTPPFVQIYYVPSATEGHVMHGCPPIYL